MLVLGRFRRRNPNEIDVIASVAIVSNAIGTTCAMRNAVVSMIVSVWLCVSMALSYISYVESVASKSNPFSVWIHTSTMSISTSQFRLRFTWPTNAEYGICAHLRFDGKTFRFYCLLLKPLKLIASHPHPHSRLPIFNSGWLSCFSSIHSVLTSSSCTVCMRAQCVNNARIVVLLSFFLTSTRSTVSMQN